MATAPVLTVEWVRLQLDLEAFDDAQLVPYLRRCQQSGIDFTTMADVGDTTRGASSSR